jgi:hypothetical protein
MQDAFNLAWKLALVEQGRGLAEPLLRSYSIERSAVGEQVLKNAERFTTVATLRNPATQWLRNHIAPILGSFHFVQDKIRDQMFELAIEYRQSPLSAGRWPAGGGGLESGDRMCDARLTSAHDHEPTSLFAAIRGVRHALLLLPASRNPEAVSELVSLAADAARAFPAVFTPHVIVKRGVDEPQPVDPGVQTWLDVDDRLHQKL